MSAINPHVSAQTPLSVPPGGNQYGISHAAMSSRGLINELMVAPTEGDTHLKLRRLSAGNQIPVTR